MGGIFVYYNNQKKFSNDFYAALSLEQLQHELINIIELILQKHSFESNFVNTNLKGFEDLQDLIEKYCTGLKNQNRETLTTLPFEFQPRGIFQELAIHNSWQNEFIKISKTFNSIYSQYLERISSS